MASLYTISIDSPLMSDCMEDRLCRICYCEVNPITKRKDLISPCKCNGSVKYVHYSCLKMWRMRGKAFGDMGKCEQCHGKYNIPGEKAVYSILVSITTSIFLVSIYVFANLVFKNTGDLIVYFNDQWGVPENDKSINMYDVDRSHYLACIMFLLSTYKLRDATNIVLLMCYILSYITLGLYHLQISRIIFLSISLKFITEIYRESYKMMDGFYYYLMNLNWEKKYLKG